MIWIAFTISPGDIQRMEIIIDGNNSTAEEEVMPGQHDVRCTAIGGNPDRLSLYTMTFTLGNDTLASSPPEIMPDVPASVAAKARRFR